MIGPGGRTRARCPICGAAAQDTYRPFCSKRCADIDLGRWLDGSYSVPVVELDESDLDDLEAQIGEDDDRDPGARGDG